jgi:hypothetical protein
VEKSGALTARERERVMKKSFYTLPSFRRQRITPD